MASSSNKNLFTFDINTPDAGGIVRGKTVNQSVDISLSPDASTPIVDVVSDFRFFGYSRANSREFRDKVPFVYLEELEILSNSFLTSLRLYSNIIKDIPLVGVPVGSVTKFLTDKLIELTQIDPRSTFQQEQQRLQGQANALAFSNIINLNTIAPYQDLYNVAPTGFKYIFPYFDNKKGEINNNFDDTMTGFFGGNLNRSDNYFGKIFSSARDIAEIAVNLFNAGEPTSYVEMPKYFKPGEYEKYTVKFNLLNTFSKDDIQRNYDLLFLLSFQNLPFRKDLVKVKPPKIYTMVIPGEIILPFCFIEGIKINYIGNRRLVPGLQRILVSGDKNNPTITKQPAELIIPDCFEVTITLKSLIRPSGNLIIPPTINVREEGLPRTNSNLTTPPAAESRQVEQPQPRPLPQQQPQSPVTPPLPFDEPNATTVSQQARTTRIGLEPITPP